MKARASKPQVANHLDVERQQQADASAFQKQQMEARQREAAYAEEQRERVSLRGREGGGERSVAQNDDQPTYPPTN